MGYLHLSISELHNLLVNQKVTPEELANECLLACKNNNDNAFEYILSEEEINNEIKSLEKLDKNNLLWGIPYVAKDNFSTKDIPTTASSNILIGYKPIFDATVIDKLKKSGAILIAKTTMDELAMGGSGTTGHLGTTYNPYDPTHTHLIGGSSCGSAVAVASGIVPFSLGSDTGDSVRKPASHAGLIGFKPSWGRISRFGLFPFAPSLDHVAFFTRNISDSATLLSTLSGRDDKDMTSYPGELNINLSKSIKGKKIAVIKGIINSINDQDILNSFNKTIGYLKEEGAIIEEVDFDEKLLKAIFPTYFTISCAEATSNNANLDGIKFGNRKEGNTFEEVMINTRSEGFGEMIKRRFVIGSFSLLKENQNELFFRAQKCRRLIVNETNKILKDFDAIYCPASPSVAPKEKNNNVDKLSNEYLVADNWMAIGNFAGLPSLTLPIGFKDNLPFGANINGRAFDEETVLLIALAIEKHTGYKDLSVKKEAK